MTKKLPFMPLYVDDLLEDTEELSNEQFGAYMRFLCTGWKHGGSMPNDDHFLARACRVSMQKWPHLKPVLWPFLTIMRDGRVTQRRMARERARALARSDLAAQAANKRWQPKPKDYNGSPYAPAHAGASATRAHATSTKDISSTSHTLPDDLKPRADALGAAPAVPPSEGQFPVSEALLNTKLFKKGH